MNETLSTIFGLCGVINLIITYTIPILLDADLEEHEKTFWRYVFIYQYSAYKFSKDELSTIGMIILEIIITLCTFASSVYIFISMGMLEIFLAICHLFFLIFKKRRGKYEQSK